MLKELNAIIYDELQRHGFSPISSDIYVNGGGNKINIYVHKKTRYCGYIIISDRDLLLVERNTEQQQISNAIRIDLELFDLSKIIRWFDEITQQRY